MCRCVNCGAGEGLRDMELCNNCVERFRGYLDDITITYVDGKLIYSYQGHMIDDCADGEELYISLLHEFMLTV